MKKTNNPKQMPIAHIRMSNVQASIWERKTEKGTFYDASFQRSYKDGEGVWQHSQSGYNLQNLLLLEAAVRQTILKVVALNRKAQVDARTDDEYIGA